MIGVNPLSLSHLLFSIILIKMSMAYQITAATGAYELITNIAFCNIAVISPDKFAPAILSRAQKELSRDVSASGSMEK
jgi:hypothetical protein